MQEFEFRMGEPLPRGVFDENADVRPDACAVKVVVLLRHDAIDLRPCDGGEPNCQLRGDRGDRLGFVGGSHFWSLALAGRAVNRLRVLRRRVACAADVDPFVHLSYTGRP